MQQRPGLMPGRQFTHVLRNRFSADSHSVAGQGLSVDGRNNLRSPKYKDGFWELILVLPWYSHGDPRKQPVTMRNQGQIPNHQGITSGRGAAQDDGLGVSVQRCTVGRSHGCLPVSQEAKPTSITKKAKLLLN